MKDSIKKNDEHNTFNYKKLSDSVLINDFIFLCYFLGNDFLPHIICIDINKEGISYLLKAYAKIMIINNQSLLVNYDINIDMLTQFIKELASKEQDILQYNYNNVKHMRIIEHDPYKRIMKQLDNLQIDNIDNINIDGIHKKDLNDPIKMGSEDFNICRAKHYKYYWDIENKTELEDFACKIVDHYIIGLQWVTFYYFDKCRSWDWYFPFDQAPFLTDIYNNMDKIEMPYEFILGKPIEPHVQLLAVLPPQSSYLLPKPIRKLMHDNKSSLKYLYPIEFKQDFINKHKFWQGVPFLPPLDIELVKHIYNKYKSLLDE
jgi:5'-3' exonuclease